MTLREAKEAAAHKGKAVLTVIEPPYTMVAWKHGRSTVYGFAKCSPLDKFDHDRGVAIATGRAIAQVARRLAE